MGEGAPDRRNTCWSRSSGLALPYIDRVTEPARPEQLGAVLRAETPRDDAGAETFDRYEWQTMMATVDLLGLYLDALHDQHRDPHGVVDCGLVCEYHEDWVRVVHGDVQLVSGKHKEAGFGAYTTASSLLKDGGVYHLFDRWIALGKIPRCRLVTTAGLTADAVAIGQACAHFQEHGYAAELPTAVGRRAFDRLISGVTELRAAAGDPPLADLRTDALPGFLAVLTLQDAAPRREFLPTMAPSAYSEPIATAVGYPHLAAEIWEAVLSLVRIRMRAASRARRGLLPTLAAGGPDELERRTITVADAHVAITAAITTPGAFAPLPRLVITNTMAVKMHEGRCAATSIDRAETLRKRFNAFRRVHRSTPGGREIDIALELLLRRVADHATASTRTTTEPWGAAMWTELESRLTVEAGSGTAATMDTDMLLGGIADLTNNCKVWFSESFDARARVQELRRSNT